MQKFVFGIGMISLMLFTLTACGSGSPEEDPTEEISQVLGIDVSAGEELLTRTAASTATAFPVLLCSFLTVR